MRIDKERRLFFGCRIDAALRDALGAVPRHERHYFEGAGAEEPRYLQICALGDESWIGRIAPAGMGALEVDDLLRNVISILRRLCPDVRIPPSGVKIFVMEETTVAPVLSDDEEAEADNSYGERRPSW